MTTVTSQPPETNFNTVTSWLPLTTAFTAQPSQGCSSLFWARMGFNRTRTFDPVAFDPGWGITVDPAVSCLPAAVTSWWEVEDTTLVAKGVTTRYSIGPMTCPSGYTTAGTSVLGTSSTSIACCPSNYKFVSMLPAGMIGECTSPISSGATITYVMEATPADDFTVGGALKTTSTVMDVPYYIVGIPINGMNFGTTTTSSSSSSSSSSTSTSAPEILAASTSSSTSSTSSTPSSSSTSSASSGLSTGAQAGIGAGVAVAALAAIGFLVFLFLRGRRRNAVEPRYEEQSTQEDGGEWEQKIDNGQAAELQVAESRIELDTAKQRHEMATEYPRYELSN